MHYDFKNFEPMKTEQMDDQQQFNISFSGCGFMGIYHVGVASAIKEYAPHLVAGRIAGASAGAIAACSLLCNVPLGQGTSDVLKIVIQARSRALGAVHPSFRLVKILREGLRRTLPPDAHKIANGRLFISLTRFSDGKNVLVSTFESKEDLIQALICSSFIPFYCGTVPPTYKGVRYIDGGWSDNLPSLDGETITVSPFSGESDICPADPDSASFLTFSLNQTSIRFTGRNLYRFAVSLFPPHPEVMSQMCRQGFEDALRFLSRNGLISCTRCLSVQSCLTLPTESLLAVEEEQPKKTLRPVRSRARIVLSASESEDCETCRETAEDASGKGLPHSVKKTLADAINQDKTLLGYIFGLRPVKWLRFLTIPWLLPWDITYQACVRILEWLPSLPSYARWISDWINEIVSVVMKEIDLQRHRYSARFTCQLAVTEMNYAGAREEPETTAPACSLTEVDFGFAVDVNPSARPVKQLAQMVQKDSVTGNQVSAAQMTRAAEELEWEGIRGNGEDDFAAIVEYTKRHEALMAYYYLDENQQVKMTEIFGLGTGPSEANLLRSLSRNSSLKQLEEEERVASRRRLPSTTTSDSEGEEGKFFVPGRRRRSDASSAYDAEESAPEDV